MKVRKIGVVSCLEHVTLKVNVSNFVKLEDFLLVDLFQGVSVSVEFDKRDSAI